MSTAKIRTGRRPVTQRRKHERPLTSTRIQRRGQRAAAEQEQALVLGRQPSPQADGQQTQQRPQRPPARAENRLARRARRCRDRDR